VSSVVLLSVEWPAGRGSASQAEGRGFEARRPLSPPRIGSHETAATERLSPPDSVSRMSSSHGVSRARRRIVATFWLHRRVRGAPSARASCGGLRPPTLEAAGRRFESCPGRSARVGDAVRSPANGHIRAAAGDRVNGDHMRRSAPLSALEVASWSHRGPVKRLAIGLRAPQVDRQSCAPARPEGASSTCTG
jgi:hypothetical protein